MAILNCILRWITHFRWMHSECSRACLVLVAFWSINIKYVCFGQFCKMEIWCQIKLFHHLSLTCWLPVGSPSVARRWPVGGLSVACRFSVGQLLADCWPTVGGGELFFTITLAKYNSISWSQWKIWEIQQHHGKLRTFSFVSHFNRTNFSSVGRRKILNSKK